MFSHFLNARVYSKEFSKQSGFAKWSELAQQVFESIIKTAETLREDLTVVLVAHTKESVDADGNKKVVMRSCGNVLDNSIVIPSYFTYILHTQMIVNDFPKEGEPVVTYKFLTNNDGTHEAKTPEGLFPAYIDNDLAYVIQEIHNYEYSED